MDISVRTVVTIVIGIAVLLIVSFMANSYITGGQETLQGWIP